MEVDGVCIANGSGNGSKKKSKAKDTLDGDYIKQISNMYTEKSTKHKQMLTEKELKPVDFHLWGTLNKIKDKSHTLSKLVDTKGLKYVANHRDTLNTILNELGLIYEIVRFKTKSPQDKVFVYDIHSVPRWSFYGVAMTDNEAIKIAAERGLEFFVELST